MNISKELNKGESPDRPLKYVLASILLYGVAKVGFYLVSQAPKEWGGTLLTVPVILVYLMIMIIGAGFYVVDILAVLTLVNPYFEAHRNSIRDKVKSRKLYATSGVVWIPILIGYFFLITQFPQVLILHPVNPDDMQYNGTGLEMLWFVGMIYYGWENSVKGSESSI